MQSHPSLDTLPCAAMLVDARLRLQRGNRAAQRALAAGLGGLRLRQGLLQAATADVQLRLQQAAAQALQQPALTRAMLLPGASGTGRWPPGLRVAASALPGVALLTLRDPQHTRVETALLQDLFALTAAEASVASALCEGLEAAEIAQATGVQPNTVNAHVKRALAKTGTRRQAQLVALLLRSVAACGAGHA